MFRNPAAEAVLRGWLDSPLLVDEGAAGLVELSVQEGSLTAQPSGLPRRPPLRPPPIAVSRDPRVAERSDAILTAVEKCQSMHADDPSQLHRSLRAAEALAMLGDTRAVELLLRLQTARDGWTLLRAFRALAYRGIPLPSRRMASALEPFLTEWEVPGRSNPDQWYAAVETFELLLAGDDPRVAIERMRRLPNERLRSLSARELFALSRVGADGEMGPFLIELSRSLPETAHAFPDLIEAIGHSVDVACGHRILEMLEENPERPAAVWRALEVVAAHLLAANEEFRHNLVAKISKSEGELGMLLSRVAGESGSVEAAIALLSRSDLRPIESILKRLLGELVEAKVPAGQGGGYYLVSRDAGDLKRRLAAVVRQGPPNDVVASRLLAFVRTKRVEHGLPQSEPLHPDIEQLRIASNP